MVYEQHPHPSPLATLCELAAQRDSSKTPRVCGFLSSADSLRWLLKQSIISEAPYLGHVHSQRWCARSARSPRTLRDGLTLLLLPKLTSFFGARRTLHLFSLACVRSDPRHHVSSSLFDSQTFQKKKKQDLLGSPTRKSFDAALPEEAVSRFLLALKTETAPPPIHHLRENKAYLLLAKIVQQAQPLVLHGPLRSLRLCEGRITFQEPHPTLSVPTFQSTLASSWVCTFFVSSAKRRGDRPGHNGDECCGSTSQPTKYIHRASWSRPLPRRAQARTHADIVSAVSKVCRPSPNGIHQLEGRRRNLGSSVADVLCEASQTSSDMECCDPMKNVLIPTAALLSRITREPQ